MKEENIKFLDENRHHHETLVKAFYLRSLSGVTRETMQMIMSEEFQPGYLTDLWCGPCVSDMVLALYRNYDNWVANQQSVEPEVIAPAVEPVAEPIVVAASFPAIEPPPHVTAITENYKNGSPYPSNKKRRR